MEPKDYTTEELLAEIFEMLKYHFAKKTIKELDEKQK